MQAEHFAKHEDRLPDRGAYADLTNFHAGSMISPGFLSPGELQPKIGSCTRSSRSRGRSRNPVDTGNILLPEGSFQLSHGRFEAIRRSDRHRLEAYENERNIRSPEAVRPMRAIKAIACSGIAEPGGFFACAARPIAEDRLA
jgi:hypothetical protein